MPAAGRPGGKPARCGRRDARGGRIFGSTRAGRNARSDRKFGSTWPGGPAARGAQEGGTMTDERATRPGDELQGPRQGRAVGLDMRGQTVAAA